MATSSKVQFRLETLRDKAIESIDFRIAAQTLVVDSFDDDAALEQRVNEWRENQEAKISDLFRRLNDDTGIDNLSLSRWKLDPIPEVDRWERVRAERDLQTLLSMRSKILAKSESLVPDENGNIALTKTQLGEFFGL